MAELSYVGEEEEGEEGGEVGRGDRRGRRVAQRDSK